MLRLGRVRRLNMGTALNTSVSRPVLTNLGLEVVIKRLGKLGIIS